MTAYWIILGHSKGASGSVHSKLNSSFSPSNLLLILSSPAHEMAFISSQPTKAERKRRNILDSFFSISPYVYLVTEFLISHIYIYILFSFPLFWLRLQHLSSFSIASDLISLYPALSSVYPTYSHPLNISKMQIWSC